MPASQPACKNAVSLPNQIMRTKVAEYEGEKRVVLSLKREPAPPLAVFNYTTRHDRPTEIRLCCSMLLTRKLRLNVAAN